MDKEDTRHGGAYDRGGADFYYGRPNKPHFYKGNTGSVLVEEKDMTSDEIEAYNRGYEAQTETKYG